MTWSVPARAVSPAAEALFQEGRRLLGIGQIDEACARLTESYAVEASSGTLLNLALCHEKQGKTATSWAEYRAAARLARNQGREDRAVVADEKVAVLEPRLPRLRSILAKPLSGLKVATESGTLGEGGLGVPVPIDPGLHKITASAPGYRSWDIIVEVKEREQLTLEIPALEAEPTPPSPPPPAPMGKEEPRQHSGSGAGSGGGGDGASPERAPIAIASLGSLGIVGLAAGAVFALKYRSENEEAKALCRLDVCRDQAEKDRHEGLVVDAHRDLTIGLVVAGTGGVALLTAAYLWWRSGARKSAHVPAASVTFFAPARQLGGVVGVDW